MTIELTCCVHCGKVSTDPLATTWQSYQVGRFAFSILVQGQCPDCKESGKPPSPTPFLALVGLLEDRPSGKDEALVCETFVIVTCPVSLGGCGKHGVLRDGQYIGRWYDKVPYVNELNVTTSEALCPSCAPITPTKCENQSKPKKHKHKKKKKHHHQV